MGSMRVKFTLNFEYPVKIYALVIGGFFPLSLAFNDVFLIDRNILSVLLSVSGGSARHDSEANKWWLDYLDRPERKINPVLCAMESSDQSIPTYERFCASFIEASEQVREYLPNAQLISFGQEAYEAAYATIMDTAPRYELEQRFLLAAAPLLAMPVAKKNLLDTELTLFSLRSEIGLDAFSLPFIATLSCLYESHSGVELLVGRKLIKPSENYGKKQAHNTLSDLRALEYLALANGLGIGSFAFCTMDRALAAFWCALKFEAGEWSGEEANVNLSLEDGLFPALTVEELNELYKRLGSC